MLSSIQGRIDVCRDKTGKATDEAGFVDELLQAGLADDVPEDPWDLLDGLNLSKVDALSVIGSVELGKPDERQSSAYEIPPSILKSGGLARGRGIVQDLFEDATLQKLAQLLKTRVSEACLVSSKDKVRQLAMRWLFCSADKDYAEKDKRNSYLTLREVLAPFGARHYVIQSRVIYQLYMNAIPIPAPLPRMFADRAPEVIDNELGMTIGLDGADNASLILHEAWLWPGIRLDMLMSQMSGRWDAAGGRFDEVLNRMIDKGYIGLANGCVFAICRNPKPGQRRSWCRLF